MSPATLVTVIVALCGIVVQLGWFVVLRSIKDLHEIRGPDGAIARIHARIDAVLKDNDAKFQTREAAEMQFEHLRTFMEEWQKGSERRHEDNIKRFEDLNRKQQHAEDRLAGELQRIRTPPSHS